MMISQLYIVSYGFLAYDGALGFGKAKVGLVFWRVGSLGAFERICDTCMVVIAYDILLCLFHSRTMSYNDTSDGCESVVDDKWRGGRHGSLANVTTDRAPRLIVSKQLRSFIS